MKKWRGLVYGLTLSMPMTIYLIIVAISGLVNHNIALSFEKNHQDNYTYTILAVDDEKVFLFDDYGNTDFIQADVVYHKHHSTGNYGTYIYYDDIIKVGWKYYNVVFDKELDRPILKELKLKEAVKSDKNKVITIAVGYTLLGVGIVSMIISSKMNFHKKYPIIAVLVALGFGTGILALLNSIISSILNVFVIALLSWLAFTIEYYAFKYNDSVNDSDNDNNDRFKLLEKEVDDLRRLARGE